MYAEEMKTKMRGLFEFEPISPTRRHGGVQRVASTEVRRRRGGCQQVPHISHGEHRRLGRQRTGRRSWSRRSRRAPAGHDCEEARLAPRVSQTWESRQGEERNLAKERVFDPAIETLILYVAEALQLKRIAPPWAGLVFLMC